jgi:hypothetical protein
MSYYLTQSHSEVIKVDNKAIHQLAVEVYNRGFDCAAAAAGLVGARSGAGGGVGSTGGSGRDRARFS